MTQQPHYEQSFDPARDAEALSNAEAAVRMSHSKGTRGKSPRTLFPVSFLGLSFLLARRRGITSAPDMAWQRTSAAASMAPNVRTSGVRGGRCLSASFRELR